MKPNTAMFLPLRTTLSLEDAKLRAAIEDIASKGFEVVYLQFRDSFWEATDPRCEDVTRRAVAHAKDLGLRVWLSLIPDNVNGPTTYFAQNWPEAVQTVVRSDTVSIEGGRGLLKWWSGRQGRGYLGCVRAFFQHPNGAVEDVTTALQTRFVQQNVYRNPRDRGYRVEGYGELHIEGLPAAGDLWIYTRWTMAVGGYPRYIDYARPEWRKFGEDLLARYSDLPLDGIGWDEFGVSFPVFGAEIDFGALTPAYFERFQNRWGYSLEDRLHALDHGENDQAALVRFHHWSGLAELHHEVLREWKERVRQVWPHPDFTMGIHMTLIEWSCDDIAVGSLDLFGAVPGQSAGFTDSMFYREDGMLFSILLARGLGDASESGLAWNNSWDHKPTVADLNHFTRLMAMNRTGWLAHMYGPCYNFGPGYPDHPTWDGMEHHVARLKTLDRLLDGTRPRGGVALLYTWAGCCRFRHPRDMHLLREGQIQAVTAVASMGHHVDIIGPHDLASCKMEDDLLCRADGKRWHTLLLPWGEFLDAASLAAVDRFVAAGGRLVLWGPPPVLDADGADMSGLVERWTGTTVDPSAPGVEVRLGEVCRSGNGEHPYAVDPEIDFLLQEGQPDHWRTHSLPTLRPGPAEAVMQINGQIAGTRHTRVVFSPLEIPLFRGLLESLVGTISPEPELKLPGGCWGRVMENNTREARYLALMGRMDRAISGPAFWRGREWDATGARFAVWDIGTATMVHREESVE